MKGWRRILSCLLISLMLVNNIGFYGFLVLLRDQITEATVQKIQSNLNEPGGSLIVKVPLPLPYAIGTGEYEPASGSFTYEGNVFQTIKRKFYNDTLYLMCIHDQRATDAGHQISDLAKSLASEDQQNTAGKLDLSMAKFFYSNAHDLQHARHAWVMENNRVEHRAGAVRGILVAVFHPPCLIS